MSATAHVYEIFVRPPRGGCGRRSPIPSTPAATSTAPRSSRRSSPALGYRYVMPDGSAPSTARSRRSSRRARLVMTWHTLYDAEMAEEPLGRVEWTLTPANDDATVTRVTLRHLDLALSPGTWANVRLGWVGVLDSMKTFLETGEPMSTSTSGSSARRCRRRGRVAPRPGRRGQQLDVGAARRSVAHTRRSRRSARPCVRVDLPLGAGGRTRARQRRQGVVARLAGARRARPR